jgi:hypothetical protein
MGSLSKVAARALREARAEVRLDSPVRVVTGAISPVASGLVVWWITGSPAWGGVVTVSILLLVGLATFATKMFTVPLAMAAAAEARVAELTALPPRDPNSIYQHGVKMGEAYGAFRHLGDGVVIISIMQAQGDFNDRAEFEYQDLRLSIESSSSHSSLDIGGIINSKTYRDVKCRVLGRRTA